MSKKIFFIFTSLPLLAFSVPVLAQTPSLFQFGDPGINPSAESLFCYLETSNGIIIDLSYLCGSKTQQSRCDSAYPDVCIPPTSIQKMNCPELKAKGLRNIRVLPPDPQGLDTGGTPGIGCED
jgi:hypothetical protein